MEQRYIPGDLIMTNGMSGGTAKDVIYRVVSSDPSRIFMLDDGTVLKGIFRLGNLEGAKLEDKGYLYYGSCHVYFKDIVPIPLTPEILDKNKWKRLKSKRYTWWRARFNGVYYFIKPNKDYPSVWELYRGKTKHRFKKIRYVHQLQHFLFGLELNSDMRL
jgi:hypothetical protein